MEYTIRPLEPRDSEGFASLRRLPGVYETMMALPSETDAFWADTLSSPDPDLHTLAAVVQEPSGEERLIGTAGLQVFSSPRKRHRGSVGVMVHPDYQGRGVGTSLLKALLDLADNWLMLVRLELDAYPDNTAALHLYERLGFEREGILRKAAIRDGKYSDLVMMSRLRHVGEPL